jgi:hypothetical protein
MKTGEYARLIKGAGNAAGLHKCRLIIGELRHGDMGPQVRVTVEENDWFDRRVTANVPCQWNERNRPIKYHDVTTCTARYVADSLAGFSFWVSPYVLCPEGKENDFPFSLYAKNAARGWSFDGKECEWNATYNGAPVELPEPAATEPEPQPTTETTPATVPETSTQQKGEPMDTQQITPADWPQEPAPKAGEYSGPDRRAEIDPLRARAVYVATFGAQVVITGAWIWAKFQRMPDSSIRDRMKAAGFRWSKGKAKWYYAGAPSRARKSMSWQYVAQTYGVEPVTEDAEVTA